MKEIFLTKGKVAFVDDDDYEWLSKQKWYATNNGKKRELWYAKRSFKQRGKNKSQTMHVSIMNPGKGFEVDHIDGYGLNNQRSNLRIVTHRINCHNSRHFPGTSKYKGVSKSDKKWRAMIRNDGRKIHLGYFETEIEAAKAYDVKAKTIFGDHATLNLSQKIGTRTLEPIESLPLVLEINGFKYRRV